MLQKFEPTVTRHEVVVLLPRKSPSPKMDDACVSCIKVIHHFYHGSSTVDPIFQMFTLF